MINEWWIVAGFACVTLIITLAAYLVNRSAAPAVLRGNGTGDDAPGLQAWLRGKPVSWAGGAPVDRTLDSRTFRVEGDWLVDATEIDSPRTLVNCTFVYASGRKEITVERVL